MTSTASGLPITGNRPGAGDRRSFRTFMTRSAALAVPVAALLAALPGSAASAATQQAGPAITGVTWHRLTLLNGWKSSQATLHTGNPSYAISGGVVYLSGSLHGGKTITFAVLPKAARPPRVLYLPVYTQAGSRGTLLIKPDGHMAAYSNPAANARGYTSLAAVSYPTASIARHKLTLANGWTSQQQQYNSGDPAYSIKNHVVYLSGSLAGGTNTTFAVPGPAVAAGHFFYRSVYAFAGAVGQFSMNPAGTMSAFGSAAQQFTSLAGVSYPVAGVTRHKLTLLNGWKSTQQQYSTANPSYSIINGVVYLSGGLHLPSGTSVQFAVLPPAARPAHVLYITVHVSGLVAGTLKIRPDGHMSAYSEASNSYSRQFTSIDAISYPHNS
jgi:hypothetical protein